MDESYFKKMRITFSRLLRLNEQTWPSGSSWLVPRSSQAGQLLPWRRGWTASPNHSGPAWRTWSHSALSCATTLGVCAMVPWPWRGTPPTRRASSTRARCTWRYPLCRSTQRRKTLSSEVERRHIITSHQRSHPDPCWRPHWRSPRLRGWGSSCWQFMRSMFWDWGHRQPGGQY